MSTSSRKSDSRATQPRDDDATLLARIEGGDRDAFATLYRRYHRPLFAYLVRLTGRRGLSEELVDDVLLVVWRRAGSFAGRSKPSSWIFGIAHRKGMKGLEKLRRRPPGAALDDVPEPAADDSPSRTQDRRELAGVMARALAALPADQRAVVVLTYHHGLAYPQIAEVVGCPVGTVKSRMFHARRKLAGLLPPGFAAVPSEGAAAGEGSDHGR
jgi:RNA polymerase sigma-70 factor (ECF subfamily)